MKPQAIYEDYVRLIEFLTIPGAMDAMNMITISLLTTDEKTQKLIGVRRETIKAVLKNPKNGPKILAR